MKCRGVTSVRYTALLPAGAGAGIEALDVVVESADVSLGPDMDESYTLDVPTSGTATIRAPTVWGALRALETLAQLIEFHPDGAPMGAQGNKMAQPWGSKVDACHQKEYTLAWAPWHIADAPRFQHRGLMLDTARHFFTVPGILRQFDAMAAAKLNTMHWHHLGPPKHLSKTAATKHDAPAPPWHDTHNTANPHRQEKPPEACFDKLPEQLFCAAAGRGAHVTVKACRVHVPAEGRHPWFLLFSLEGEHSLRSPVVDS